MLDKNFYDFFFISDIEVVEKKKIIKLRMLPIVDGGGGKNVIDIKERYLT
jgi:hypothetical protein